MLTLERTESHLAGGPSALQQLPAITPQLPAEFRRAQVIALRPANTARESDPRQGTAEVFVPFDTQPFVAEASIDPLVLKWMPVAVPGAAVLLCACIAAVWTLV